jgi:hypothetical protein
LAGMAPTARQYLATEQNDLDATLTEDIYCAKKVRKQEMVRLLSGGGGGEGVASCRASGRRWWKEMYVLVCTSEIECMTAWMRVGGERERGTKE